MKPKGSEDSNLAHAANLIAAALKQEPCMTFASLGLSEPLQHALQTVGYTKPTPVQQQAIPAVLDGRDLMVAAQTGTGKTASFALPILQQIYLSQKIVAVAPMHTRVLVLTPTRELAAQVHDSFRDYAKDLPLRSACIFGGVSINPQIKTIAGGLDILIACPGRLLDLAGQRAVDLSTVETLVLDEADRMLDMGFIHDVKKVLSLLPSQRQNLLFSATFSKEIVQLAHQLLKNPDRIEVTPPNTTVEQISQRVFHIDAAAKRSMLLHLVTRGAWEQVLVFTRTKHGANRLAGYLNKQGLSAAAIHGNKSQNARTKALTDFKTGDIRVLVATDIAARGLDIDQLPHVVNFDLPNVEEDYVHRIGRTGRAGRSGEAVSLVAPAEEKLLRNIERLINQRIVEGDSMGFDPASIPTEPAVEERPERQGQRQERSRSENSESQCGGRHKKTSRPRHQNRTDKPANTQGSPKPKAHHGKPQNDRPKSAAPASLPPDRPADEFRDDEYDNFGNSVNYVSPYQGKGQKSNGRTNRNNRPGGNPNAARSNRGTASGRGNGTGRGHSNYREPLSTPAPLAESSIFTAQKPKRQPVIIHHKTPRTDRTLTIEQLDQLSNNRASGKNEKPALLTRND